MCRTGGLHWTRRSRSACSLDVNCAAPVSPSVRPLHTLMSLLLKSKAEGVEHLKRGMLILAAFGYFIFLNFGMDRGLGALYRTPNYCWAALASAVVAAACGSKRSRWLWGIAGVAAIAGCLYAYHQNSEWRETLRRVQAQQASPSPYQTATNR